MDFSRDVWSNLLFPFLPNAEVTVGKRNEIREENRKQEDAEDSEAVFGFTCFNE